jgi:hypothetical protein
MKKIVRLTESDLIRIIKKVINENEGCAAPPKVFSAIQAKCNFLTYELMAEQCVGGGGSYVLNDNGKAIITLNTYAENGNLQYNIFTKNITCEEAKETWSGDWKSTEDEIKTKYNDIIAPCLASQYGKDINSLKI